MAGVDAGNDAAYPVHPVHHVTQYLFNRINRIGRMQDLMRARLRDRVVDANVPLAISPKRLQRMPGELNSNCTFQEWEGPSGFKTTRPAAK